MFSQPAPYTVAADGQRRESISTGDGADGGVQLVAWPALRPEFDLALSEKMIL